jgi:ABC-type phosphate transport system substrate-binding protein
LKNLLKSKKLLAALAISASVAVILPLAVSAALSGVNQGTGPVPVGKAGHLYFQGSTTVNPIIQAAATDYNTAKGATIFTSTDILANDSGTGRNALLQQYTDIAMASSAASTASGSGISGETQAADETPNVIARDGVVIIVNSSVPADVTKITMAQLVDIYEGYDTKWSQISGNAADIMTIVPRAREIGSGTRQSLSDLTKGTGDGAVNTITFMSPDSDTGATAGTENYTIVQTGQVRPNGNPAMQAAINSPTATGQIGYVGLGFDTGANIRDLQVVDSNGVAWSPTGPNIYAANAAGTAADYPLARFLRLYTPSSLLLSTFTQPVNNAADVTDFISWLEATDGQGQNDVVTAGFLKLIPDQDVNADNAVNVLDLIMVGNSIGLSGANHWVRADVDSNGTVNVLDLIQVGNWVGTNILPTH